MKLLFYADLLFPGGTLNSRLMPLIKMLKQFFALHLYSHQYSFEKLNDEFSRHMSGISLSEYFTFHDSIVDQKTFLHITPPTINKETQNYILDCISSNSPLLTSVSIDPEMQKFPIDTVLQKLKLATSRERKMLITSGRVADSKKVFSSKKDTVSGNNIYILKQALYEPLKGSMKVLNITDAFIYITKSAYLPCMPLRTGDTDTLLNLLRQELPDEAFIQSCDDPFLYRLDNNTSGLIIAARSKQSLESGRRQLHSNTASPSQETNKEYLAIVSGKLESQITISTGLENKAKRVVTTETDQNIYTTTVTPLCSNSNFSLVQALIHKGMRHQIRVHLACSGFPIVGDFLYGFNGNREIKRHFLHCHKIISPLETKDTPTAAPDNDFKSMLKYVGLKYTFS